MDVRNAQESDSASIRGICMAAFPKEENQQVAELAANLLTEATDPPILSLVAERDGTVAGFVAFSPISPKSKSELTGYLLGPLAVSPEFQKKGVGSKLVKMGMKLLSDRGSDVLLVYGDPKYYGRFGFEEETARLFVPPYPLEYEFGWQGLMLSGRKPDFPPVDFTCVESLQKPELW